MKRWLFNPFVYVAGLPSLLIGCVVMIATAVVAFFSSTHFDGVLDLHKSGHNAPLIIFFLEQLTDWATVVLLFFPAALIWSKSSIRFVDIAGTMALARWPMILAALVGFAIHVPPGIGQISDHAKVMELLQDYMGTIVMGVFVLLPLTIWMVALMYNAFRVSCNMKGQQATGIFIAALLIAEIASKIILHQLYKHFI